MCDADNAVAKEAVEKKEEKLALAEAFPEDSSMGEANVQEAPDEATDEAADEVAVQAADESMKGVFPGII